MSCVSEMNTVAVIKENAHCDVKIICYAEVAESDKKFEDCHHFEVDREHNRVMDPGAP